jgi:hypothetical protein
VRDVITEEREEAALAEAYKLLEPLTKPVRSWAIVSWSSDAANDPRDEYEAAIDFVTVLLEQLLEQPDADELLSTFAPVMRAILPVLRRGPPKRKGRRSNLTRDRCIAAVVTTICRQHQLGPYRNPLSRHEHNGCAIVAKALQRLEINMTEETVRQIYMRHKQD